MSNPLTGFAAAYMGKTASLASRTARDFVNGRMYFGHSRSHRCVLDPRHDIRRSTARRIRCCALIVCNYAVRAGVHGRRHGRGPRADPIARRRRPPWRRSRSIRSARRSRCRARRSSTFGLRNLGHRLRYARRIVQEGPGLPRPAGPQGAGPAMTIYTSLDDTGFNFQAGIPVAVTPKLPPTGDIDVGASPDRQGAQVRAPRPVRGDDLDLRRRSPIISTRSRSRRRIS